jgi:hypothetical protein
MHDMAEMREGDSREAAAGEGIPVLPIDDSRLTMMRRIKALPVAERIGLLDRMCREQTRIAVRARRVR